MLISGHGNTSYLLFSDDSIQKFNSTIPTNLVPSYAIHIFTESESRLLEGAFPRILHQHFQSTIFE